MVIFPLRLGKAVADASVSMTDYPESQSLSMPLLEEEIWEVYLQSAPSSFSEVQIFFILLSRY